jgi:hypothetical protein
VTHPNNPPIFERPFVAGGNANGMIDRASYSFWKTQFGSFIS